MIPPGTFSAIFASPPPALGLSASLPRTQGPAMRNSLSAGKNSATLFRRLYRCPFAATSRRRLRLHCRGDEARKERMRTSRARLKLRMELTSDEPRMSLQLHDLDQRSIRRQPAQSQTVLDEPVAVLVVDLIAMAMTLAHLRCGINSCSLRSDTETAWISAKAHRAAHVRDVLLPFHQRNYGVVALRCELARMTVGKPHYVARELDDGCLHTETDAEERQS